VPICEPVAYEACDSHANTETRRHPHIDPVGVRPIPGALA